LQGYRQPVLVSSTDGVGTKLILANVMDRHEGIGHDIVNHCVNDIFTTGARPLFFLDYIASAKLQLQQLKSVVKGMADACRQVNCALIGGETAEMPGMYARNEYDVVGFVVGVVEKSRVITGEAISPGDLIIGLASSGLHTNGYSLARRVLGQTRQKLDVYYPEIGMTLSEALLEPHRCYYPLIEPYLEIIKGMAHITGGGLPGNVVRVLPEGLCARFDTSSWQSPPIFRLIQHKGNINENEMYRVFNMGIGMVAFVHPKNAPQLLSAVPGAKVIGEVSRGNTTMQVVLD